MSLRKFVTAALAIQLVVAQENCPGLRLSTGLGSLLGDLPLSSSLPCLPSLPCIDSCGGPDLSLPSLPPLSSGDYLPTLPQLSSGDCLPTLPLSPCGTALPPLAVPYKEPCLCKRALQRKRRCGCKESLLPVLPFAPVLPSPCFQAPLLAPPCYPTPFLEPYPLLKSKCGCHCPAKNKLTNCLLEKLLLKKGLALGFGPDCGPDVGLLPDAVSTFAVDALARPLAGGLDDCGCL